MCTHNSARSQFAAALWSHRSFGRSESAGTEPAARVHPAAIRTRPTTGSISARPTPKGYDAVALEPDLVMSVCDRAREADLPFDAPSIHWSIPDPVAAGSPDAFRTAFAAIAERVDRLAERPTPRLGGSDDDASRNRVPAFAALTPAERVTIRQSARPSSVAGRAG